MKEKQYCILPGLAHRMVSENMYLLLDVREEKIRYIGLICRVPFGHGYMMCPFVHKRLTFNLISPNNPHVKIPIPHYFKTLNRAWKWFSKHVNGWHYQPRYTVFNPLIKYLGVYGPRLYAFCQESKLHLALTQFIIAVLTFLYPVSSTIATIATKGTAAIMCVFGIINLLILIHDRKSGQRGGNNKDKY